MTAPIALFDFDGTIVRRDSTRTLVAALARLRPWRAVTAAPFAVKLKLARSEADLQRAKCALIGRLVRGADAARLQPAIERAAEFVRADRRPEVLDALRSRAAGGSRVLVVSASPGFFLRAALRDLPVDVVATEFAVEDGRHTGAVTGAVCFGAAKVPAITARVEHGAVIDEAWTDSLQDLPMMRLARRRFWLCPPLAAETVRRADPEAHVVATDVGRSDGSGRSDRTGTPTTHQSRTGE